MCCLLRVSLLVSMLVTVLLLVVACETADNPENMSCHPDEDWCARTDSCVRTGSCSMNASEALKIAKDGCGKPLLGKPAFDAAKGYWIVDVGDADCKLLCVVDQGKTRVLGSCIEAGADVEQKIRSFATDLPTFRERTGQALVVEELVEGDNAGSWMARLSFVADDEADPSIKRLMVLSIDYEEGAVVDYTLRKGNSLTLAACEELSGWPEKGADNACDGGYVLGLLDGFIEPHYCCVKEPLGSLLIRTACLENCSRKLKGAHLTSRAETYDRSKEFLFVPGRGEDDILLEMVPGDYSLFLNYEDSNGSMVCYPKMGSDCEPVIFRSGRSKEIFIGR